MKTIKVLVADDHAQFRKVVCDFLKKFPQVVVVGEASTGDDAIDLTVRLHPHLVLMDINMPGQDGLEATRRIKQQLPSTRVLIATMHEHDAYRIQALEARADGFTLKSNLKNALRETLAIITAESSTPHSNPPIHETPSRTNQPLPAKEQQL